MDLPKAQRLLLKIQAFLDNGNGHDLSRLEKDLMKSYIIQLYDAVTSEESIQHAEEPKRVEVPVTKPQFIEPTPVYIPEAPKPVKPVFPDIRMSVTPPVPEEIKEPDPEPMFILPKPEPEPIAVSVKEHVTETVHVSKATTTTLSVSEGLAKLFDLPRADDVSDRFAQVTIPSIESAMGLNERIFTLNDLFGGDKGLFDSTVTTLNSLNSFSDAKQVLLNGPASKFGWDHPERLKMAEQFIRIVARRYPKS